ncbi:MAG: InlB B-repeat-containing protein [Lachnospiraceae bacterium]|nr:InlB B-repeat-containing protein [Lachnospiraceae bacterium]
MNEGQKIVELRGIEGLVYAELLKDTDNEIQFGPVKKLAGVATLAKEVETNTETHYYDNKPAVVIDSNGPDTVTINTSALDVKTLADITGQKYVEEKKMLVEGKREQKYFAIGYKTKMTDGSERYVWRLKGKFSVPNEEYNTEDDGTDANGQELTYTGIETNHKFSSTGDSAKSINIDKTVAGDNFFEEVKTPDTFTPVVVKHTLSYNANGATEGSAPSSVEVNEGSSVTVAQGTGLVKDDVPFSGWNDASDGSGTAYAAGSTITMNSDKTLYAQFVAG